ncbi:MAG: TetR/AcrR family transcriptional regulator, partial [Planctomycetota bacterium]
METSRRAAKRQRILTAALDVFRRGGFRDANVSDIALVAGVGKGTIYEYYKSKDDLFLDVCRMMVGTATESALRPEVMALPPALRLMAMLDGLLAQHAGFTD